MYIRRKWNQRRYFYLCFIFLHYSICWCIRQTCSTDLLLCHCVMYPCVTPRGSATYCGAGDRSTTHVSLPWKVSGPPLPNWVISHCIIGWRSTLRGRRKKPWSILQQTTELTGLKNWRGGGRTISNTKLSFRKQGCSFFHCQLSPQLHQKGLENFFYYGKNLCRAQGETSVLFSGDLLRFIRNWCHI